MTTLVKIVQIGTVVKKKKRNRGLGDTESMPFGIFPGLAMGIVLFHGTGQGSRAQLLVRHSILRMNMKTTELCC